MPESLNSSTTSSISDVSSPLNSYPSLLSVAKLKRKDFSPRFKNDGCSTPSCSSSFSTTMLTLIIRSLLEASVISALTILPEYLAGGRLLPKESDFSFSSL